MDSLANDLFDGILTSEGDQREDEKEGYQAYEDDPPPRFSHAPTQHAGISGW
jgi:hypothetical protein